jgi:P-type E1-E2 ATPase
LEVNGDGRIINYHLRQPDQKRASVLALKSLQFRVLATGDAYNDTSMLGAADAGSSFAAGSRRQTISAVSRGANLRGAKRAVQQSGTASP